MGAAQTLALTAHAVCELKPSRKNTIHFRSDTDHHKLSGSVHRGAKSNFIQIENCGTSYNYNLSVGFLCMPLTLQVQGHPQPMSLHSTTSLHTLPAMSGCTPNSLRPVVCILPLEAEALL